MNMHLFMIATTLYVRMSYLIICSFLIALCRVACGQGTYTYASGNVYVGDYENGKMHGHVS
jgi:hypothetical protein